MRSRIEIGGARPYKFLWGSFLVPRDRVKRTLNKLSGKASNCCYIMYVSQAKPKISPGEMSERRWKVHTDTSHTYVQSSVHALVVHTA